MVRFVNKTVGKFVTPTFEDRANKTYEYFAGLLR
jgi:hypothetical protein